LAYPAVARLAGRRLDRSQRPGRRGPENANFDTEHGSANTMFLDALRPGEVHVLWRDKDGYTRSQSLDQNQRIMAFMDAGANLGDLWVAKFPARGE